MNILIPLAIVIPLAGAFLSAVIPGRLRRVADVVALAVTGGLIIIASRLLFQHGVYEVGGWQPPIGILLVVDGFSSLMFMVVAVISFAAVVFSVRYMDQYTSRGKYYTLFLLMVTGMTGAVLTGDIFNFYVFLEIAAISSYALVAFGCDKEELEASFKYAVLGSAASTFLLLGIAFLYMQTGTLNMADIAARLSAAPASKGVLMAAAFILAGLGVKAALIPFHAWLPDAHPSAPAPISAMLSGVLIKAIGVYALARIVFNVFGAMEPLSDVLIVLGLVSMVGGGLLAVVQTDIKRLLAYSSISQMGYIVLAFGIGTPLGLLAGLFHLVNHAVFKSLLFLGSGAIEMQTGTRDLSKMGGLARRMPITAATSFTGAMSISGVPPFNGFFSKLLIIIACVQADRYGLAAVAILISMVTLGYFLKMQRQAFMGDDGGSGVGGWAKVKEVPFSMAIAMIMLAVLCLGMSGLAIPGRPRAILESAAAALSERQGYKKHLGVQGIARAERAGDTEERIKP